LFPDPVIDRLRVVARPLNRPDSELADLLLRIAILADVPRGPLRGNVVSIPEDPVQYFMIASIRAEPDGPAHDQ